MLTRRQVLVSAALIGLPVAATLPFPAAARGSLTLGLLQSREPFMDPHDIAGSRDRAFSAYRSLIRRSLDEHGSLDWLAGGAFPLSGPGPFPATGLERVALSEGCPEMRSLSSLVKAHRLRLTLGAWWRDAGIGIVPRLLLFDSGGRWRVVPQPNDQAHASVLLQMPALPGNPSRLAGLAEQCRRQRRYGAWIEMLRGPVAPPGTPLATFGGSTIIGPDGRVTARASVSAESCLIAEVP